MTTLRTALDAALVEIGIELQDSKKEQLEAYYELLVDWNTRMNLTTITDAAEVAQKHFADSLLPLAYDGMIPQGARCVDVGTGAGFPGIPLLIARSDITMTLLDSLNKRLVFLQEVCDRLNLNARIVHARAEDGGQDETLREQFDVVLSRAVAAAPVLMEYTLPFAAPGGKVIAYKGPGAAGEFSTARRAIGVLGGGPVTVEARALSWGERCLVAVAKTGKTPPHYPRNAGTPAKQPL